MMPVNRLNERQLEKDLKLLADDVSKVSEGMEAIAQNLRSYPKVYCPTRLRHNLFPLSR